MIVGTAKGLEAVGLAKDHIKFELFGASTSDYFNDNADQVVSAHEAFSGTAKIIAHYDGQTMEANCGENQDIIRALLDKNYDPPYSCQGGVCSTCMAQVIKGEVKMLKNLVLTKEEIAKGFILACQCLPLSNEIEIEFQ
ncbi:unnamed protein product [Notodromas monacha]|uniref:2Fe-2S ferredoxin-type domain-containing protein n=1 Tax=Notodromas monacha TaxID=399045 RepID=A0A7R9C2H5_9CRUS|nr:unnamed protein product [Notodromas monacha]CAG0926136.1 unnamed protein product [Notodromas monacha]